MQRVTGYGACCARVSSTKDVKCAWISFTVTPHLKKKILFGCVTVWVDAYAVIFVLCSTNALSEYQLTISLAVLQSRKFCSVSLACHHFSAALLQPTDLWSILNCKLQRPSYCLACSPSHSVTFCPHLALSNFALSLSHWTDSRNTAATGSDRGIRAQRSHSRGLRLYVRTCVIPCVKLCSLMCGLCTRCVWMNVQK